MRQNITFLVISFFLLTNLFTSAQDGTVDSSFAINGHTMTQVIEDKDCAGTDVIVLPDGKILVSGTFDSFGQDGLAVVRYNPDGTLDATFGENGIATTFFNNTQVQGITNKMGIQSDGKIVLSGYTTSIFNYDIALTRLTADGQPDETFGENGGVLTQVGSTQDYSYSMVIQNDDKIVLVGSFNNSSGIDAVVLRYLPDGQLDSSFGTDGIVITDFEGGVDDFRAVCLQADGKIVAGGYCNFNGVKFAVARYNTDGSLDNSFDMDGKLLIDNLVGLISAIESVDQNQLLIVGSQGGMDVRLAKVNEDGSLDNTFGNNGTLITNFINSSSDGPVDLLVQDDNKFVVIASTWETGPKYMSGQRFNSDGTIDVSFGDGGAFFINLNQEDFSKANNSYMSADGSIFIAGRALTPSRIGAITVLKINNSGQPFTDITEEDISVSDFHLYQNFPNPFNPSTTINFTIPNSDFVSLKVYDITGKEVADLVNKFMNSGSYSYTIDFTKINNFSSGVYFYRLQSGTFTSTKKFILLK